jgi:biopolymer transport protein TolR
MTTYGPVEIWNAMGAVGHLVLIFLFLMSFYSIGIMIDRWLLFRKAQKQSLKFVTATKPLLADGKLDQVVTAAKQFPKSHLARIYSTAILDLFVYRSNGHFVEGYEDTIRGATEREGVMVTQEYKRGLSGLASIGATAPNPERCMEARGRRPQADKSLNSEINVTPLVDVMLVVLIIFMLVTPMLQKGVGVDLPKARNVQAVSEDKNQILTVVLQPNGQMYLGTDPIDRGSLTGVLRMRYEANPTLELQIKADRGVRYGDVKQILQAGREAGFRGASMIAREIKPVNGAGGAPEASPEGEGD